MTGDDILDLMIAALIRKAGGSARHWRLAIGPVRVHHPATHLHCNWSVSPSGNPRDVAAIEHLLDEFRLSHSLVTHR
ncbi:hypothetical protein ASG11_04700 [Sphingomonas sp. Leaf357]|uniref:hypothetical protein n=1 Tax=Sphingomonas sp. Leaf357 TaxID=1736350 RepID=UPI0007008F40|nr:hypothetical protein [Sphingomonas sp. Leaf357]KQS03633.1 hypothetical protein ASG11_04700 [Sphingomonas sp. Leaf357]